MVKPWSQHFVAILNLFLIVLPVPLIFSSRDTGTPTWHLGILCRGRQGGVHLSLRAASHEKRGADLWFFSKPCASHHRHHLVFFFKFLGACAFWRFLSCNGDMAGQAGRWRQAGLAECRCLGLQVQVWCEYFGSLPWQEEALHILRFKWPFLVRSLQARWPNAHRTSQARRETHGTRAHKCQTSAMARHRQAAAGGHPTCAQSTCGHRGATACEGWWVPRCCHSSCHRRATWLHMIRIWWIWWIWWVWATGCRCGCAVGQTEVLHASRDQWWQTILQEGWLWHGWWRGGPAMCWTQRLKWVIDDLIELADFQLPPDHLVTLESTPGTQVWLYHYADLDAGSVGWWIGSNPSGRVHIYAFNPSEDGAAEYGWTILSNAVNPVINHPINHLGLF